LESIYNQPKLAQLLMNIIDSIMDYSITGNIRRIDSGSADLTGKKCAFFRKIFST
jgi:hypothetical protein